jgi:hypothetical protein
MERLGTICYHAAKSQRERLTLTRIFEELRGLVHEAATAQCVGTRELGTATP